MITVVYLANQHIQVVTGSPGEHKIGVTNSYEAEAPEGSIINGIVMDSELFVGFIKEFWNVNRLPNKNVHLVINSSKFVGKTIEMPELSASKTYRYIAREFADIDRGENYLYSCLLLGSGTGKTKRIYSESVEPEFVKDYIDIFRDAGITLKSMASSESSIIGITAATVGKQAKTFTLVIADNNILTTILWINGSFYYFNSMRSFYDKDTEEYAGDLARAVSQIIQFMQAHQIEQQLEKIVVAGISGDIFPMYRDSIEQMGIGIPVQTYDAGNFISTSGQVEIQRFLYPASGLVSNKKQSDFLRQYSDGGKRHDKKKGAAVINMIPIIVAVAVMVVAVAVAGALLLMKKNTLKEVSAYNEDPVIVNQVTEYDMMIIRNRFLSSQYHAIDEIDSNLVTYPLGDSRILARIDDCTKGYAEIKFDAFDAEEGTIQMTASADSVKNINIFIKKLMGEDIFNNVDYTGYSYNDTSAKWDIHVTCILAESAGR